MMIIHKFVFTFLYSKVNRLTYFMNSLSYDILNKISTFIDGEYIQFGLTCREMRKAWANEKRTNLVIYKNTSIKYVIFCIDCGFDHFRLFLKAIMCGNIPLLDHIFKYLTDFMEDNKWRLLYITACNYGQLETIKWAISNGIPGYHCVLNSAISAGNLDIIKWAIKNKYDTTYALSFAMESGNIDILKWLISEEGGSCVWNKTFFFECEWAIWNGHLDILKYARSLENPVPWGLACRTAIQTGNLEILQWLRDPNSREDGSVCPWDLCTYELAQYQGNLDIIEWLEDPDGGNLFGTSFSLL